MPLPLPQGTAQVLTHLADAASALNAFLETARQGEFQPWLWLVTSAVIQFLAVYLTSKILTHETSRLANAVKVLARLWVGALCVALLAGAGIWIGAAKESTGLTTASVLLLPLLLFAVLLAAPKSVHKISWTRSLFFFLASALLFAAGDLAARSYLGNSVDGVLKSAQAKDLLRKLAASAPGPLKEALGDLAPSQAPEAPNASSDDALAADRFAPLAQRHAAIQRIYAALEARRVALNLNDANALQAYSRDEARYKELLQQLQADAAADPGAGGVPAGTGR